MNDQHHSPAMPLTITTRDGRALRVRHLVAADAGLLERMFYRLSPESIYRRFFIAAEHASPELVHKSAQRLAAINPRREAALVALADEQGQEEAIAVARFARLPHQPQAAEASILVRDDYQGTGVGRQLLELLLEEARAANIERLIFLTHADNTAMIRLATGLGLPFHGRHADGLYEIQLLLQPQARPVFEFIGTA
ncbi:GNAT family N-acetyltransferase [uncultured Chloroflexus sp.]|uniref:GNAT family N-acetyltransferase n=1 Tax=uncultured Chloroflexus sp. TaxID=214040 RepID=UPI0026064595|nr:GNAT family N-acetyltransferase [uncultured Chloroflexus sp.]